MVEVRSTRVAPAAHGGPQVTTSVNPLHPAQRPENGDSGRLESPRRIAVVSCAVLEAEVEHYAKPFKNLIHFEWLPQGLHNEPDRLRTELQLAVDRVENQVAPDAIVLGYGLCSRGTEGVFTRHAKLVMPRAHDCITVLLGSKERYSQYVRERPGTYWYSPGWLKHHTPPGKERYEKLLQQYVEKYGAENAEFLMQEEQNWFKTYDRATYVNLTIGATERDLDYTRECAQWLGWSFDHQRGDPSLLESLLAGEWDDNRFIILEPGQTLRMTADERVVEVAPVRAPCPQ